ncbi:P-loop containing nucleoside triphosphate hydrolase protein [Haematococcus lacustris]
MAQAHGRDLSTYAKAVAAAEQLSSSRLNQVAALLPQALAVLRASPRQQQGELRDGEERLPASQGQGGWLASISSMEAAWLGFGLYKALDREGDVAGAWSALTAANQQAAAAWPYSPDPDWRTLATLTRAFKGPLPGLAGWRDRTPLFIVGLPRSGSTLVEQLLAAHPQVWAAGEDTLLAPLTPEVNRLLAGPTTSHTHLSRQLQRLGQRYVEGMRALVPAHHHAGSKAGDPPHEPGIRADKEPPDPLRAAAVATAAAGEEAGAGATDDGPEAAHGGGQPGSGSGSGSGSGGRQEGPVVRIVDKMLHNLWLVGHIQLLLPDACVVHVARHPLDAGLSCYAQPFASPGMAWSWDLGHIAAQINMTWRLAQHWEATLTGRMHTLLYEELVAHPELAARRLLAACGLDWAPQVLRFHTLDRPVSTASLAQVRKELYSSSVGRWRRYAQQLKPLIDALGGTVAMYERRLADTLSTYPAEAPAPAVPDPLLGDDDTDQPRSFGTNTGNAMASQEHVEL